ncbi:unnamed protein product [Allacma fusca]|uniref:CRAL-TRIO domain-containing protein n=1 Tax=Allacma fusca TaxID=39272 RepID=A0A8J2KXI0_9HEXA|nr:unnamed protein product [Allacma fusca]
MSSSQVSDYEDYSSKLQKLKLQISDVIEKVPEFEEDFYLYFYLKAEKFSVDKAETNIRENLKWRAETNVDHLLKMDYTPEVFNAFPFYKDGKTKGDMIVWRGNAGKYRFSQELKRHGEDKCLTYWLQILIKGEKQIFDNIRELTQAGLTLDEINKLPLINKNWLVLNMGGLAYNELLSAPTMRFLVNLVRIVVTYFPFMDGTVVFVNAGKLMEMFFKLIRPFLKGSNVDLIVFDSDSKKWKTFIYEHVDPSQICVSKKN